MRKILLTASAAAAVLSGAVLGNQAKAATLPGTSALSVAAAQTGLVQKAAVVCGNYGCVRVHPRYRYYNYYPYYGPYYRPYGWYYGYGPRWYW